MKVMKKALSLILALLMLVWGLTSCATPDVEGPEETTPEQTTPIIQDPTLDENGYKKDNIPTDINYGGNEKITIFYWEDVENPEFFAEANTGDIVNDAINKRNAKVEERLGVKFEYIGEKGNYDNRVSFAQAVQNAHQGGKGDYDIIAAYSMTTAECAMQGYTENLLDYDQITFGEMPWWPTKLTDEATINDKLYFCAGDLSTNLLYMMYAVFFNSTIYTDNLFEETYGGSIYQLVDKKEWTYDAMFNMSKAAGATADTSGTYGIVFSSTVHYDSLFYGAGLRTVDQDEDTILKLSPQYTGETAQSVAEKCVDMLNEPSTMAKDGKDTFINGDALFIIDRAVFAKKNLGNSDLQFGICPIPLFKKTQDNYSSCYGFPYTLYAITKTANNKDACAYALECLSSEAYRTITPAVYEITMKVKYTADVESAKMFDLIRDTSSFDTGRIYSAQLDKATWDPFRSALINRNPNFTSALQGTQGNVINAKLRLLGQKFA